MGYLDEITIERLCKYCVRYLNSPDSEEDLTNIIRKFKEYYHNISMESTEQFDKKINALVRLMENENKKCSVFILKNKNDLFDIYFFEEEVEFAFVNLVSSEALENTIRENPVNGYVIDNVSSEDILVFLKAYYIYRRDPSLSKTSLNLVTEYDYDSFEMAFIDEKFNAHEPKQKISFKHIILYDKEALPYNLNYLNDYKEKNINSKTGERFFNFPILVSNVRENRFLGMSLRKFYR